MTWNHFPIFVILTLLPALLGAVLAWRSPRVSKSSLVCSGVAVIVFCAFAAGLWLSLGRPPLRTLGETRLWYSLFMLIAGMWVYRREGYRWMPSISLVIATVFMIVNLLKPDLHDQSLMPALRSFWFVPHVTSYIFSYSLFGCAFLLAVLGLWQRSDAYLPSADRLVRTAFIFLTFGLPSGCVWAKQAWGTYWSWDPKETWGAATWAAYLVYVHWRLTATKHKKNEKNQQKNILSHADNAYLWLVLGFALLQMCWYGADLLPAVQDSMHRYAG